MAATDITYGGLDPVLYTPDFSFLRYTLDKKTGQYEQGLKSASSSYNNLKRELSDPVNAERREQYLKEAQGQLQKVASSDLSLQQNVNFANSIFDPLATDKAFLIDSYYTANNKKELAKMDQWANSSDPEERKKFNPEIQAWLKRDLDSIKNGKGDVSNYKVEGRSAFAFVDPQEILDKAVKDKGFKYKVDEFQNPYIVTTEGGKEGRKNYDIFAQEVLSNDPLYQQQTKILAQNSQESILDMYKNNPELAAQFANADPKDIYKDYFSRTRNDNKKTEQLDLERLSGNLEKVTADNDAFINANADKLAKGGNDLMQGIDSPEARMFKEQQLKETDLNNLKGELDQNQKLFDLMYKQTSDEDYLKMTASNPMKFFYDQRLKKDINTFSTIKSTSVERTVKEDRAVIDVKVAETNALKVANDIKDDIIDNLTDQQKLALKEAELKIKGLKTVTNKDGTTSVVSSKADIVHIDTSATEVNTLNNLNTLSETITTKSKVATESMINAFGILENMGMDSKDVGILRNYYRQNSDLSKPITGSAEGNKALSVAFSKLMSFADKNKTASFLNEANAIKGGKKALTIKELPNLLNLAFSNYECKTQDDVDAKRSLAEYSSAQNQVNLYSKSLNEGKQFVINTIQKDPAKASEYSGMIVNRGTKEKPNWDLINKNDVKGWLSGKANPYATQEQNKLNKFIFGNMNAGKGINAGTGLDDKTLDAISEAYINGTLEAKDINIGVKAGDPFSQIALKAVNLAHYLTGDKEVVDANERERNNNIVTQVTYNGNTYILPKLPLTAEKYKNLTQKINKQIQIPGFQDVMGKVAGSPFYELNGESLNQAISTLGEITTTNSQIMVYGENTGQSNQITDDATLDLIRTSLGSKDAVSKVLLITNSPTNSGKQAVKVEFAPDLKKGDSSKNPLAGRSFFFPITPTETSQPIFKMFDSITTRSDFDEKIKKGDPYVINAFEADGVKVEFRPSEPGSNTGKIVLFRKKYNPVTKSYSDTFEQVVNPDTGSSSIPYDVSKTTPDELEQNIYTTFIYPHVTGKLKYQKEKDAIIIANGGTYTGSNIKNYFSSLRN